VSRTLTSTGKKEKKKTTKREKGKEKPRKKPKQNTTQKRKISRKLVGARGRPLLWSGPPDPSSFSPRGAQQHGYL